MIEIVFVTILIIIFIIFLSVLLYQSIYKSSQQINIKKIQHHSYADEVSNNTNKIHEKTNLINIYFKDTSSKHVTSGLINNIYIDLIDNTRIPIQSTKHKTTTPIEFSELWLFKQTNIKLPTSESEISSVIFDFVYIDITIDMNTRYRIYMHDNNTFRMGEIIKYDFNKTLHWFDQSTKQWTPQHTNHTYTAPLLQSTIKLIPKSVSVHDNKIVIDCPINSHILPLIP
jgi:hypothetical protein